MLAAVASLALAASAAAGTTGDSACQIDLTPETAALTTGSTHTVTAAVTATSVPGPLVEGAEPIAGCFAGVTTLATIDVHFAVTSGPNAGKTGVVPLDANGKASFSYVGMADGTDSITAGISAPARENCLPQDAGIELFLIDCPTVTLTDTAVATWTSPVVQAEADPSVAIATSSRCVSRKLTVRPSYAGGTINSSTLFIDSKKVKAKSGSGSFVINTSKFKSGRHHIELVTVFSNGKSASKFGSFTRCKVRTAARKVTPQFTG